MRRWLAPLWVLGFLLALPAGAGATPVTVDVSTATGVRLGRLLGDPQGGATYYLLTDVARLASATTRRGPGADRMRLISRHGVVQVTRDARRIMVDGRAVSLSAPVRVRQGTWRVPGDLLGQALPTLLGTKVRVTPGEIREVRAIPPAVDKPIAQPAVAAAPKAVAVPALAAPQVPAASTPPDPPALPRPAENARPEPV